jgi:hypothetical protein
MITMDLLVNHLNTFGWQPDRVEDGILLFTFLTEDEEVAFPVTMQIEDNWVRMTVPVFLPQVPEATWPEVARLALLFSNQTRLARYVLLDNGSLAVCTDVYAEDELPYEQFEVALDTLCFLAESTQPRLLAVANGQPDPAEWDEEVLEDNAEG